MVLGNSDPQMNSPMPDERRKWKEDRKEDLQPSRMNKFQIFIRYNICSLPICTLNVKRSIYR